MSEYSDEFDDENEGAQGDGPAGLRKALKEERARAKKLADDLKAIQEKLAEADKANRATVLKEALTAVGGDAAAKIAKFYPSDSRSPPTR
jgi:hypothetical protein